MTRTHNSYAVSALRVGAGGRESVYVGGQDVRIAWQVERPYGGGWGDAPYENAPYGGATDGDLRGAVVEIWFGRTGAGTAPYVKAREIRTADASYVYRESDNRADAARYGLPFQAAVRFVVRPWTVRGTGVAAETVSRATTVRPSGGTEVSTALSDLIDVAATAPADGDALVFDSGTGKWINAAPTGGSGDPWNFDGGDSTTVYGPTSLILDGGDST